MAGKKVLLVEGSDDKHVMGTLCDNRGLPRPADIRSHDGVDDLLKGFPVRLKESGVEIIGIVIDADTDLVSRWEAIRQPLIRNGYANVPTAPLPGGTILDPPADTLLPRVDVWIMPNNQTTGILEDFFAFSRAGGVFVVQARHEKRGWYPKERTAFP